MSLTTEHPAGAAAIRLFLLVLEIAREPLHEPCERIVPRGWPASSRSLR